jgi:tetratricopeptide (TPR) repeat protein
MFQGSEFRVKSELPKRIHLIKVISQYRAMLLDTVEQRLSMNRYAVLVGPRASGKTSLAVEYAYQHKESYSSIFWLDARSDRTLELSFVRIAHELQRHYDDNANQSAEPARYAKDLQDLRDLPIGKDQIPISEKDRKTTVLTVLNWFQCPGNKEWLLIYDDVKHPEAPFLRDFLPAMKNIKSKRGYVLITSRSDHANPSESKKHQVELSYSNAFWQLPRAFGPKPKPEPTPTTGVKEYFIDPIEVKQFSQEESVALLNRSLEARSELTDREKRDISESPSFTLPMNLISPERQNLEDVADKLRNNPLDIAHVGAFISASDAPLLVPKILTDDLCQIAEVPKEYSFWYDACIMLGSGPIPVQLVERYFHLEKKVIDSSLKTLEYRGAVWIPDPNSGNFEIPHLTLRSRHQWLTADRGKAEKCAELACNAVVDYLEYLSTEIGPEKPSAKESGEKTVLEHVDACLDHYRDYRDILCEWDILAQLCESYGFYSKAAVFYRAAHGQRFRNEVTEAQASQEHKSDVSESALIDAWFKADDPAQNRALASDSKSPAPLFTILSADTQNSRKLRNEVALIRMQLSVSNFEHPNTQLKPKASGGAGKDYGSQARSGGELIAGCLRIMKEVEDRNEDRYVSLKADVMRQMVLVSKRRGDWLAAVQWNRSLIDTLEKLVGPNAEETMKAIQQLAEIRMDQADFGGATPLLEHALLTYEQIFGGSHRKSIAVVERLARAYSEQGDLRRARDLYRRVVDARSREFGEQHIETAKAQESLAKVYIRMEDKKEADKWYKQALDTASIFGEDTVESEKMLESHRKLFEQLDFSASSSRN